MMVCLAVAVEVVVLDEELEEGGKGSSSSSSAPPPLPELEALFPASRRARAASMASFSSSEDSGSSSLESGCGVDPAAAEVEVELRRRRRHRSSGGGGEMGSPRRRRREAAGAAAAAGVAAMRTLLRGPTALLRERRIAGVTRGGLCLGRSAIRRERRVKEKLKVVVAPRLEFRIEGEKKGAFLQLSSPLVSRPGLRLASRKHDSDDNVDTLLREAIRCPGRARAAAGEAAKSPIDDDPGKGNASDR